MCTESRLAGREQRAQAIVTHDRFLLFIFRAWRGFMRQEGNHGTADQAISAKSRSRNASQPPRSSRCRAVRELLAAADNLDRLFVIAYQTSYKMQRIDGLEEADAVSFRPQSGVVG